MIFYSCVKKLMHIFIVDFDLNWSEIFQTNRDILSNHFVIVIVMSPNLQVQLYLSWLNEKRIIFNPEKDNLLAVF